MAKKNENTLSAMQKKAANKICLICDKEFTSEDISQNLFIYVKAKSGKDNFIHNRCMKQEVRFGWENRMI
ncbi:hypothetical protein [Lachnoclostridium phytofermentans]|uniref:hypothetical protein n=1 Tax=Lachnoclostridium phytofermentans TaxID=66219 RepID=UPI0005A14C8E|nr:hypothetical protein [Lachnoclostridium phytofermentans]